MAFDKHWSFLFCRPIDDSKPQQPQQPAPVTMDGANTHTFLQTKLFPSINDVAKLISDASNRFDRDHNGVHKLLDECREAVKCLDEKSVTRDG
jgi:hypothetical protein